MIFAFAETKLIITHWLVLGILFWKKKNNNKYSIPTGIFAAKREGQQSYIMTGRLGLSETHSHPTAPLYITCLVSRNNDQPAATFPAKTRTAQWIDSVTSQTDFPWTSVFVRLESWGWTSCAIVWLTL